MKLKCVLSATIAMCLVSGSVSADIIVSFGPPVPSPIAVSSTGVIDVFVHSENSDMLDAFQATVKITPVGASPAGGVKFTASQSDSQLIDSTYVFAGNSLSFNTATPVGTVIASGDTYTGFDATFDFTPITLSSTGLLLFQFELTGVTAGSFQIDFTSATFVKDQSVDLLDPLNVIAFSSTPGTITVNDIAEVPEPSTTIFCGIAAAVAAFGRRRFQIS